MKLIEKVRYQVAIRSLADALEIPEGTLGFHCPFHEDPVGTLTLKETENRFTCSQCRASGSQVELAAKVLDLSPEQAVEWLAERFDIQADDTHTADLLSEWKTDHEKNRPTLHDVMGKADNRDTTDQDRAIYNMIWESAELNETARIFLEHKGFDENQIHAAGFRFLERPRILFMDLSEQFGKEALDHAGLLDRNREFIFQDHALLIPFQTGTDTEFLAGWDMSASRHPIRFPAGKRVPPYRCPETTETEPVFIVEDLQGALAFYRFGYPALALPGSGLDRDLIDWIKNRPVSVCGESSDKGNQFNRSVIQVLTEHHVDFVIRETGPAFEDMLEYLTEKRK